MRLDQQRLNKVGAKRALNSLCLLQQDPCLFIIIIRSWQEAQQPGTHRPRVSGFPTLQFWNLLGNCTPKSYSHNAASYFPLLKISIIYVYTNGKLHPPISSPYLVVNFMKLSSGCLALKEAKRIITDGLGWRGMTEKGQCDFILEKFELHRERHMHTKITSSLTGENFSSRRAELY